MVIAYCDGNKFIYPTKFGYNYIVSCIVHIRNKKSVKVEYPQETYY